MARLATMLLLMAVSSLQATMMSSVTYQADSAAYSITYTFDKQYECGQYANGDWWAVVDPGTKTVAINQISPNYTTGRNGWLVNPSNQTYQPFDNRAQMAFDSTLMPNLPYQAKAGESVVKAASAPVMVRNCWVVEFAAVLTVVAAIPADSGRTVFRPPFAGTDKPMFSTTDLQTQLLPNLAPVTGAITQATAEQRTRVMRMDYTSNYQTNAIQPLEISQYGQQWGAEIMRDDAEVFNWLCLNNPLQNKMLTLIRMVQYGIDLYGARKDLGINWVWGGGGNGAGRMLPFTFAATMLNSADIRAELAKAVTNQVTGNTFWETEMFFRSSKNNMVLWGNADYDDELSYWEAISVNESYNRTGRDMYGWIDGGSIPGQQYQGCVSAPVKYTTLVPLLIPQLQTDWPGNYAALLEYADRWTTQGTHTLPDPCAPAETLTATQWTSRTSYGYGTTWGPDPAHPGDCIRGTGRFPQLNGTWINSVGFSAARTSAFCEAMWAAYRNLSGIGQQPRVVKSPDPVQMKITNNPLGKNQMMAIDCIVTGPQLISVTLYSMTGEKVRQLAMPEIRAGANRTIWDGKDGQGNNVPAGIYYLEIKTTTDHLVKTIAVIK